MPKKSLAQNFIIDDNYLSKIIAAIKIITNELVLEVGPGSGYLTRHLVRSGAKVFAIEKDLEMSYQLIDSICNIYEERSSIKIMQADVLKVNLARIVYNLALKGLKHHIMLKNLILSNSFVKKHHYLKLIANLPYNIIGDFLEKAIVLGKDVSKIYLMVQDEVGHKIALADPGNISYRSITVRMRFYSSISYLFTISQNAFYSQPNVSSCIIEFNVRHPETYPVVRGTIFEFSRFIELCFHSKRKMLKNNCASFYGEETIINALKEIGCNATTRSTDLKVEDFTSLYSLVGTCGIYNLETIVAAKNFLI